MSLTQQPVHSPGRSLSFYEHLKQVLESYDKPEVIGSQSPLAAPYFLGTAIRGAETSALGRGKALCIEIQSALEAMWWGPLPTDGLAMLNAAQAEGDTGGRYDCLLLELNYFKQRYRPAPKNQAEIYDDILHISRPTHDRHLRGAVARLGTRLLQRLKPAVRPEQPITPPTLIGRDAMLAQVVADLEAGKTVSLTGPGGIGKTSLGAVVTEHWSSPAIFWYTFRPTLNDQVESLLFALGHFLHTQGASTLWHQLIADGGRIKDVSIALGLTIGDLKSLAQRPLLCFDELDFLRPLTQDQAKATHTQVLEFLDSLRGHTALLLIGQRAFWQSDAIYAVDGWTQAQLATWLVSLSIAHTADEAALLHRYTAGNPRLAELCVALYQTEPGATLAEVLEQLPQFHALLPIWLRLERRLPLAERQLLQALSVFRSPAPADAWLSASIEQADALTQLIGRRLVQEDEQGGVALLPALREVVYAEMPVERQEELHAQAAQIRAERGEYTAAAYHLQRAGQPEAAIELWYSQREHEIHRGRASAALAIFEQISLRRLSSKREKELRLLRSELYQLTGAPEQVVSMLGDFEWAAEDTEQVDASLLLGKAYDRQGQGSQALRSYADGITAASHLLSTMVELHVQRSLVYLHERDMQTAWQEAHKGRYLVENMIGTLCEQSGQLVEAQSHYLAALKIAEEIGYQVGVAKSYHNLGNVASRLRQIDRAIEHYGQAMATEEAIGNRVGVEVARSGMVTTFMQAGRYTEAIPPAQRALTFFRAIGDSFWVALNASNLAEAFVELGNYDDAEANAQIVLAEEEPHSHPYALFTLGRVRQGQGRPDEGEYILNQARGVAEMNGDRYLLAYCWEEIGNLQRATNQPAKAAASFAQALQLFQTLKIEDKVVALRALLESDQKRDDT